MATADDSSEDPFAIRVGPQVDSTYCGMWGVPASEEVIAEVMLVSGSMGDIGTARQMLSTASTSARRRAVRRHLLNREAARRARDEFDTRAREYAAGAV